MTNLAESDSLHLYPDCIDSHVHLHKMAEQGLPLLDLLPRYWKAGLRALLDVAVDVLQFDARLELARKFPAQVLLSAGIHPLYCAGELEQHLAALAPQLQHDAVVAVGECGLDFHRMPQSVELQYRALRAQLALAREYRLPLIIHNRSAGREIAQLLLAEDLPAAGVLHCFDGDLELARLLLPRGFYFSFAGNLTYKNAHALKQAASQLPLDRLLVETDAPYLSPQAQRDRVNHPGWLGHTLDELALLRGVPVAELAPQLATNFFRLFQIPNGLV